jgi:hypothetical protein
MRRPIEWLLRLAGLGLLVWAWSLSIGATAASGIDRAGSEDLRAQLERWSSVASPGEVNIRFSHGPGPVERDWLAALAQSGTRVRWSAESLPPTATSVTLIADPAGGAELAIGAPSGATVILRDTLGARDTLVAPAVPFRFQVPRLEPGTEAVSGGARARDEARDSIVFRRLLLLGRAGWESRFVAAALAERGWSVDARFVVAPGSDVHQGIAGPRRAVPVPEPQAAPSTPMSFQLGRGTIAPPVPMPSAQPPPAPVAPKVVIDTTRYSAVLVLDSTAGREAGAIGRYLGAGGGIVLWSSALSHPGLRAIAAGGSGPPIDAIDDPIEDSLPRRTLALVPLMPLHPEAVVLERRGSSAAIAARRLGPGRVVQVGYQDLWRWPLGGDSLAPGRYRDWIAGLVARVALVGRTPHAVAGADPAPHAALVDRLGPPTPPAASGSESPSLLPWWLLALLALAFLLEWASRRMRGAR